MRCLFALVMLAGCLSAGGGDVGVDPDDSVPVQDTEDTGTAYTGVISGQYLLWETREVLEGGEVCWRSQDFEQCAVSDAEGLYRLEGLPVGVEGAETFDHPDAWPTTVPLVLGEEEVKITLGVDSPEMIARLHEAVGVALDPALGVVCTQVYSAGGLPQGGVSLALDPPVGVGPFYLGRKSELDLEATSTVGGLGIAYFFAVPPGPTAVVVQDEGLVCDQAHWGVSLPSWSAEAGREINPVMSCREGNGR